MAANYKCEQVSHWGGMKVLGLTGSIGTGKSTVSKLLSAADLTIIDADIIAKEQTRKGTAVFYETIAHFPNALNDLNEIDRTKLATVIFSNPDKRSTLNSITHPWILLEIFAQVLHNYILFKSVCVLDIPLLFEGGLDRIVPSIILVYWYLSRVNNSDPENQIKRLMARNGYSEAEARMRIESQLPIEEKRSKSCLQVDNSGSLSETRAQVKEITASLLSHQNNIVLYMLGIIPAIFTLVCVRILQQSYYIYVMIKRRGIVRNTSQ